MRIVWLSWKDMEHPQAGGAEVVTDQLLRRLVQDGHSVTLVCSRYAGSPPKSIYNGYEVVRVGNRLSVYPKAAQYYRSYLRNKTDLLIDECNTIPFFAGWYAGKQTRGIMFFHMLCRQIWFYQLPKPLGLIGYLAEPVYLRLLKRWPVVTISESTKKDLVRQGFKSDAISIISEGITMDPVTRPNTQRKYARPTLLSLGSVRSMKRTLDCLRTFEIAKRDMPELQFKIAGDTGGAYGRRLLRAVDASPYREDIEVLGRVSSEQKQQLMRRSHLLLVTSVKEGWGLVVTEANSQGTPAAVYNVDGLRDSVRDNETGIVTTPTPAALATGITRLLQDDTLYATIRTNAHQWSKQITFDQSYEDFKKAVNL